MRHVIQRFLDNLTSAGRCLLAVGLSAPFFVVFMLLNHMALGDARAHPGIRVPVVWGLQGILLLNLIISTALFAWLWPRRHNLARLTATELLVTLNIGLVYCAIVMCVGFFTAGPVLVLLALLIVGLLLFERRVMLIAFAVCVSLLIGYDVLIVLELAPDALALLPPAFDGTDPQPWWAMWRSYVLYVGAAVALLLIMGFFAHLDSIHAQLRHLTVTDVLTGLSNRRAFMARLQAELLRQRRHPRPLCLVLLDVDHFKRVNDQYGHAAGDEVLQSLAQSLLLGVRTPTDQAARLGGEEFALLLPDTVLADAQALCVRLQQHLRTQTWLRGGQGLALTVSMGVVEATGGEVEAILRQADANLYTAKQTGRDRAVYSHMDAPAGAAP